MNNAQGLNYCITIVLLDSIVTFDEGLFEL